MFTCHFAFRWITFLLYIHWNKTFVSKIWLYEWVQENCFVKSWCLLIIIKYWCYFHHSFFVIMIVFKIRLCYHFHSVFLFDFLRECFLELTFILRSIFCFLYFDHHVKKGDIYIIPLAVCALILALYCK